MQEARNYILFYVTIYNATTTDQANIYNNNIFTFFPRVGLDIPERKKSVMNHLNESRFAFVSEYSQSYQSISRLDVSALLRMLSPQLRRHVIVVELASSHCTLDVYNDSSSCIHKFYLSKLISLFYY
ncbi:hypothetical protein Hanom_Chr17g01537931 [Helianthus anomalus]